MITVRKLGPDDDLNAVLKLCRDFFSEYEQHHEEFFDTDNLTDSDISGKFIQSLTDENSATLIALMDGVIVGYISVAVRDQPTFYKIKQVGAIPALMVAKENRRRGIATMLLQEARAYFHTHGVKYFTLYTAVANRGATRLYERVGLTPLHISFVGET